MPFQFNPPDGFRNTVMFPQKPANETAFRDQMQQPLDQLRDYINGADPMPQYANSSINRQALINGNFDIWQRGTTSSGVGYLADRWKLILINGATIAYQRRATDVPNSQSKYSIEISVTNTGGGTGVIFRQYVEAPHYLAGKKVTISGFLKGPSGANVISTVNDEFALPIAMNGNWVPFKISGVVNSFGDLLIDPLRSVDKTGVYFLAQVQLSAGDVAIPFQRRSVAEELSLCQRYYEKSYGYDVPPMTASNSQGIENKVVPGNTIGNLQSYGKVSYKVQKRVAPTVTICPFTTPSNTGRVSNNTGTDLILGSGTVQYANETGFTVQNTAGTITTTDNCVIFHWTADAEI
ncbi:hypothetical protein [Paenibacillus humicus]|uniref:hypothetical protein n=1 Tax=Paenibacillus humicus TaxID=412861 RepID=UPI003F1685A9